MVRRHALVRWHGIHVGRAIPSVATPTLTVSRGPPVAATGSSAPYGLRPPGLPSPVLDCRDSLGSVALLGSKSESKLRVCRPHLSPHVRTGSGPPDSSFRRAGGNHLLADPPASHFGLPSEMAGPLKTAWRNFVLRVLLISARRCATPAALTRAREVQAQSRWERAVPWTAEPLFEAEAKIQGSGTLRSFPTLSGRCVETPGRLAYASCLPLPQVEG